jgi:hypothetical protein
MILLLGFHDLLEGGEGIGDHRRQHPARVRQPGSEARTAQARRPGRLADRAPLALQRFVGRQLVRRRIPHVTLVTPLLAHGPLDLVRDLVGHAARARLHQPALEIGDGVAAPARLVTAA